MNNIGKVIKVILLIFMLMLMLHPLLTIVFLVKWAGIIGTITIIWLIVKIAFGMSLIDLLTKKDKDDT